MNVTFASSRSEASSIIAYPVTKDGAEKIAVPGLDDAALALVVAAASGQRFKGEAGSVAEAYVPSGLSLIHI